MNRRPALLAALCIAAAVAQVACTPTLDWREVRPAGSQLHLLFPCKPSAQERRVPLAGQAVRLVLHTCSAGGWTWGLAVADVADPARVAAAMADFGAAAAANIGAVQPRSAPTAVPGATPSPGAQRWRLQGRLPDGQAIGMQLVVFSHGTRVFQATALGPGPTDEAADIFFSALRIQP